MSTAAPAPEGTKVNSSCERPARRAPLHVDTPSNARPAPVTPSLSPYNIRTRRERSCGAAVGGPTAHSRERGARSPDPSTQRHTPSDVDAGPGDPESRRTTNETRHPAISLAAEPGIALPHGMATRGLDSSLRGTPPNVTARTLGTRTSAITQERATGNPCGGFADRVTFLPAESPRVTSTPAREGTEPGACESAPCQTPRSPLPPTHPRDRHSSAQRRTPSTVAAPRGDPERFT